MPATSSILVPRELGGAGLGLAEASVLQQRLAGAAPATALAINMHLVWTGVAKVLADRGIDDLRFVQEGAVGGRGLRLRHQRGGQRPGAVRQRHGCRAPARRLVRVHGHQDLHLARPGVDAARPARPRHDLARRAEDGLRVRAAIGGGRRSRRRRATTGTRSACAARSRAPPSCTARSLRPTGSCGASTPARIPIRSCSASSASSRCCSPRCTPGIARRALDLAVETAGTRRSKKTGKAYSQDPDIRWRIADMALAYDALPPQLEALCRDVDDRVDHGARWFSLLAGVKHRAVTMAKSVVDDAILVVGRLVVLLRRASSAGCTATCSRACSIRPTRSRRTRPSRPRGSDQLPTHDDDAHPHRPAEPRRPGAPPRPPRHEGRRARRAPVHGGAVRRSRSPSRSSTRRSPTSARSPRAAWSARSPTGSR